MAQHRGDDDACHHVGERPKLEERERWVLPKYRNHGRGDDDDVEGEGWVDEVMSGFCGKPLETIGDEEAVGRRG